MKIALIILAFINGGWMLADGVFVMLKGKYMGPEKPGPWARLFEWMQVDVFKLGPLFVLMGVGWLLFMTGILLQAAWAYWLGITVSVLTLWYLPVGTLISLVVLVILIFVRSSVNP